MIFFKNEAFRAIFLMMLIVIGIIFPRPSPRIESVSFDVYSDNVLIGSSIVDHTSKNNNKTLRKEFELMEGWSIAAKAGLTPEEVGFIMSKSNAKNERVVLLGLYSLLAYDSYNIGKYLYYTQKAKGRIFQKPLWHNPHFTQKESVAKVKQIKKSIAKKVSVLNGQRYVFDEIDYEHAKYTYWNYINPSLDLIESNLSLLLEKNTKVILIAPRDEWVGPELSGYINRVIKFSLEKSQNVKIIKLPYEKLSEPWCLCGHLNDKGVKAIKDLILQ